MKPPLVSIITPSFNQAAFLEQTIQSVLEQDYPHIEYIVVDGGSTDGSVNIIKKYANRLSWWISEKDNGQAEALNKGFRLAKGEIIAWINSDDTLLSGTITNAVESYQKEPEAVIVHGDLKVIDQDNKMINLIHYGNWGLQGLMEFRIIGQPAVFMRRTALEQAGFLDPNYHFLLDHQLWLRLAQRGKVIYIPREWACARYHPQAKNVSQAASFGEEAYRILNWMKTEPGLQKDFTTNWRKCEAGAHRINARYLLDGGLPVEALRAYGRSFFAYPPAALSEWHRILFCFPAMLGIKFPRKFYNLLRGSLLNK